MIDFNLNTARFICLTSSLLCVPAFYFGTAVAWSVVMALGALILLKAHLQNIINCYDGWDNKKARCIATLKYYGRMTLEISAINTIGPVLFVYLGMQYVPSNFDQLVLDYSPLNLALDFLGQHFSASNIDMNNKILPAFVVISNAALIWFVNALLLLRTKAKATVEYVLYIDSRADEEYQTRNLIRRLRYDFIFEISGIIPGVLLLFIPLLVGVILDSGFFNNHLFVISNGFLWVLAIVACWSHFIGGSSLKKSFCKQD